jgi:hypothetical protein
MGYEPQTINEIRHRLQGGFLFSILILDYICLRNVDFILEHERHRSYAPTTEKTESIKVSYYAWLTFLFLT